MPSATGQNWEKYKKEFTDDEEPEKKITPLTDEYGRHRDPFMRRTHVILESWMLTLINRDIQVLKTYGAAPYAAGLRRLEKQIKEKQTSVNEKIGMFMMSVTARSYFLFSAESSCRSQGIRHRSRATASMGYSSGSATNVRRPSPTGRPMYQNHSR